MVLVSDMLAWWCAVRDGGSDLPVWWWCGVVGAGWWLGVMVMVMSGGCGGNVWWLRWKRVVVAVDDERYLDERCLGFDDDVLEDDVLDFLGFDD
ncbi:hypothetical protein HanHA89_Chr04g0171351 [Helianthus annuus]|nr:hypothetical protein HanHA89_Chr04g0171351 [Helianthus annuus]